MGDETVTSEIWQDQFLENLATDVFAEDESKEKLEQTSN